MERACSAPETSIQWGSIQALRAMPCIPEMFFDSRVFTTIRLRAKSTRWLPFSSSIPKTERERLRREP